ncbi:MAG: AAA family ATPase, partial [Caulobacteraceae bacterium]
VFLKPSEREGAEQTAKAAGVAFEGVWLDVPVEVMRQRLAARTGDASDADARVLEQQLARDPGAIDWKRTPAS